MTKECETTKARSVTANVAGISASTYKIMITSSNLFALGDHYGGVNYKKIPLLVDSSSDPFVQFQAWHQEVAHGQAEPNQADAMCLSTCGKTGRPTSSSVYSRNSSLEGK